jgi:SPP1 family predicted phage head-tail adaptor
MMNKRVTVAKRAPESGTAKSGQRKYVILGTFWMSETFTKGIKAMHEGALDAYDTVMFRMRYNSVVTRESRILYEGVTYQIQSLHADQQENIVQITATEIIK